RLRLALVVTDRIDGHVPRERRVVAVVPGKLGEQGVHPGAIVVEPHLVAPDLGAVRRDRVLEIVVAHPHETLPVLVVERKAAAIDQLLRGLALFRLVGHVRPPTLRPRPGRTCLPGTGRRTGAPCGATIRRRSGAFPPRRGWCC